MTETVVVRHGAYHDSIVLMAASRSAASVEGVDAVAVSMATPANLELLERQACNAETTVILLDLVLGFGAHPNPAAELAPVISRTLARREDLTIVVSVCASRRDFQDAELFATTLDLQGVPVRRLDWSPRTHR